MTEKSKIQTVANVGRRSIIDISYVANGFLLNQKPEAGLSTTKQSHLLPSAGRTRQRGKIHPFKSRRLSRLLVLVVNL
jgi:hypothetical protein